jgi:predicted molibdopterin-dependent oxidoreductase YjgC
MKEEIYQTFCPGCGVGCGLYIREDPEGNTSVDFMKSSPANLGKLCRFGMKVPYHYSKARTMVTGSKADMEDAIKSAALRMADADSVTMLSVGNTTSEEHMAFCRIAETLGTRVDTGVFPLPSQITSKCGSYQQGISLDEMEKAKRIALFLDPYVQYPLIVRRLLAAKRNGAGIVAVGTKELHLADETLDIGPERYDELGLDDKSLIVADIHPNSDPVHVKQLLDLAGRCGAKIHFMQPFINSTAVNLAAKANGSMMTLAQIMEDIEAGNIRTLVALDSDPVELMPDAAAAVETLKKLDNLIVISSRASPVTELADVVIATEPVYMKAGTFMNVEGRLQENSGTGVEGIDAMSLLNGELGGKRFDYQQLHYIFMKSIGDPGTEVRDATTDKAQQMECGSFDVDNAGSSVPEGMYQLKYLYNPFMWFDQSDDNDFVLIDRKLVKTLGLKKGGMVVLGSEKGKMKMRYRVENIPGGMVMTAKKIPVATGMNTIISLEGC